MSIASKAKAQKRPSNIGGRPRLFGALSKPAKFSLTAFQDAAHKANKHETPKTNGAFGAFRGVTGMTGKLRRKRRDNLAVRRFRLNEDRA